MFRLVRNAILKINIKTNTQNVESVNRSYTQTNSKLVTIYHNFDVKFKVKFASNAEHKKITSTTTTYLIIPAGNMH
jgi:hypothetical protein